MGLNDTPQSERLHIGIFGKPNSGKSTLVNGLAGQDVAIVSEVSGTTTDPVRKAIEINGLGACVLIDTAGYGEQTPLGKLREEATRKAAEEIDIAVIVTSGEACDDEWRRELENKGIKVIRVINESGAKISVNRECIRLDAATAEGAAALVQMIKAEAGGGAERNLLGELISEGDGVMLVMPQDSAAPKGRLILPQAQTIRAALDKKCVITACTDANYLSALDAIKLPPRLIITDSQIFPFVYAGKPKESALTSFSLLMAGYKGDIRAFIDGARAVDALADGDKVLIAEACSHTPAGEDIGRFKIPSLLKNKIPNIIIEHVNGKDFPKRLTDYKLIIHCGACMFNRALVMRRITLAAAANVPITNYGVVLAHFAGILDKIVY